MTASVKTEQSKLNDALDAVKKGEEGSRLKLARLTVSMLNQQEIKQLEEQAKNGDTEAMWKLGLCKEHGIGTKQDEKEAEHLYETSSSGGNPIGSILLMNVCEECKGEYDDEECEDSNECGEGEDENYEDYDDEDYDESYDGFADEALDLIGFVNTAKAGWYRPTKGVNFVKAKYHF